ncbi:cytoglobin-1 [Eupeodes corollae]|uniref:cytoglobin-1 n=1 Tax=Eupeodes corollae TaxID=290404 RepID=UPI00249280A8|nr:cytoglobin-1 [Eupeodes corollae]XP_055906660.1 cytoglobin-1 [Eupeodes corollae]
MNDEDIYEVKKTWEIPMENPDESGQAILIEFFTQFPSNQQKFEQFREVPVVQLKDNAKFKSHAARIVRLFDDSINALGTDYADSAIQELWKNTAKSHFRRNISKQSFNELKGVILQVLKAACNLNDRQVEAWTKLMDHVYDIVFKTLDELASSNQ